MNNSAEPSQPTVPPATPTDETTFLQRIVALARLAPNDNLEPTLCQELLRLLSRQLASDGESGTVERLKGRRIIGQPQLVNRLVMTVTQNEHTLLEGLPGVAKTTGIMFLASCDTGFSQQRIQFTPDMAPAELVGRQQFDLVELQRLSHPSAPLATAPLDIAHWVNGPLFHPLIVADEINRAPSKVQSAMLEGMAERQITPPGQSRHVIRSTREWEMWLRHARTLELEGVAQGNLWGDFASLLDQADGRDPARVHDLDRRTLAPLVKALVNLRLDAFGLEFPFGAEFGWTDPRPLFGATGIDLASVHDVQFSVFATQNPIEQQGTYALSEAQIDRFCFKTLVRYPDFDDLKAIVAMINRPAPLPDPDAAYTKPPELERTPDDRRRRDLAFRTSLYFFRRCREYLYGRPGFPGDSWLGRLTGPDSLPVFDRLARLCFYTHLRLPHEGGLGAIDDLILEPEQQDRMNFLHARDPQALAMLAQSPDFQFVRSGASPRGILQLTRSAIAAAFFRGSPIVEDQDVRAVAPDVLRHRVRLESQARLRGVTVETLLDAIMRHLR